MDSYQPAGIPDGFSASPQEGYVQAGTYRARVRQGAGRDGTTWTYVEKPYYGPASGSTGTESDPIPGNQNPNRNTGDQQDIIDALRLDQQNLKTQIDELASRPLLSNSGRVGTGAYYGERDAEGIALGESRFGTADFDAAVAAGATGAEIVAFMDANRDTWGPDQQVLYDQALAMDGLSSAPTNTDDPLNALLIQQQSNFDATMLLMQQQLQLSQQQFAEQSRISSNLANAYVPPTETSAVSAGIGDQRRDQSNRYETNNLSELSALSIVSGLGTQSNPLAGLALA